MNPQICECHQFEKIKTGWDCPRCGHVTQPQEMMERKMSRPHKYNAKSTTVDGVKFPSLKEANRYQELKLLERAGEIKGLELQPRFELQPKFKNKDSGNIRALHFIADFRYIEGGQTIIEDSKGVQTPEFKIKRKLFLFKYPDLILRIT